MPEKSIDPQVELPPTLLAVGALKPNVVLTGFMATGKSTVGRLLAARRHMSFRDTDELIVQRHGPIEEIFATQGEIAFREMERKIALELEGSDGLVIATGGRMMLDSTCARALGSTGEVFCLTASIKEIKRRFLADENGPARPLLAGSHETELGRLYEERLEAYSQFQQINTDGRTAEEVAEQIETLLGNP